MITQKLLFLFLLIYFRKLDGFKWSLLVFSSLLLWQLLSGSAPSRLSYQVCISKTVFLVLLNPISLTPLALTIDFDFDFHSLRGSKSNNALETGHRLKNVWTVSDWLHHMFLFAFPFTFELYLVGLFSWSAFSVWLNSHWKLFDFFARQVEFQTSNAIEIVPN